MTVTTRTERQLAKPLHSSKLGPHSTPLFQFLSQFLSQFLFQFQPSQFHFLMNHCQRRPLLVLLEPNRKCAANDA